MDVADETLQLDDTSVPRVRQMKVLGTMLSENDSAETACNFRISKAWGAYFMHRRLLCSRRHALCRRLKVFMSVILATVMWGLEVFCLTEQQRRRLTVTQITIVSHMMRS